MISSDVSVHSSYGFSCFHVSVDNGFLVESAPVFYRFLWSFQIYSVVLLFLSMSSSGIVGHNLEDRINSVINDLDLLWGQKNFDLRPLLY